MKVAKYVIAKKAGASNGIALLYAKDILKFVGSGASKDGGYLILSPGNDRLVISPRQGELVKLLVKNF